MILRDLSTDTALLSLNTATVRAQWNLEQIIDGCLRHKIGAISPWRDQVEACGLEEAAKRIKDAGLRVSGLCRGGMFPAADAAGLSERQRKTAVCVANVTADRFEQAVESEDPPTVTTLACWGRKPRQEEPVVSFSTLLGAIDLTPIKWEKFISHVERLAETAQRQNPGDLVEPPPLIDRRNHTNDDTDDQTKDERYNAQFYCCRDTL